jgi:hypothetical protein
MRCPTCGAPTVGPEHTVGGLGDGPPLATPPVQVTPPAAWQVTETPVIDTEASPVREEALAIDPIGVTQPDVLHIPCPNHHELETPLDMLNQYVMCPECEAEFRLREQDSIEYRQRKQVELEARERRLGRAWMNWAVMTAVFVVLGVVILLLAASQ